MDWSGPAFTVGTVFTTTVVVAVAVQPVAVTVRLYTPALAVVELGIVGF